MNANIVIGKIVKPQGIKGELKVIPLTDDPKRFTSLAYVIIDGTRYEVISCRVTGEAVFVLLKSIADRNAAELMRGKLVEVERKDAVKLPEGKYFIVDLVGSEVVADDGNTVGRLVEVLPYKTEVYRVKRGDGKHVMFPVVDGLINSTDIAAKRILVSAKRLSEVIVDED